MVYANRPASEMQPDAVGNPTVVVTKELERRGWTVADDDFARRVAVTRDAWCQEHSVASSRELLLKAIMHEYCKLLHAILYGDFGADLQLRALAETYNYGMPIARRRLDAHDAESAVHMALVKLLSHLDKCRPESFFAYFGRILTNEIGQRRHALGTLGAHEVAEVDLALGGELDNDNPLERLPMQARPVAYASIEQQTPDSVELRMMRPLLRRALIECFDSQCNAIIFLYGFGYSRKTAQLAQRLGLTPTALSIRKTRARAALRTKPCPEVIGLLTQMVA